MMKKFGILLLIFSCYLHTPLAAQNATWTDVYSILQTSCLGCHEGATAAGNLDFSGTSDEVYDLLFEQAPTNPYANNRGHKLVDAGYPNRSFLYRKINDVLYNDSTLEPAEGGVMPNYQSPLPDEQKELIRQWIYFGAPKTGQVISKDMIDSYYTNGGLPTLDAPPAPAAEEGFQLHLGSIFLNPSEEKEYIYKYELLNDEALEINRIEVVMNSQSHHFLFFKFDEGADADEDEGLEEVTFLSSFITGDAVAITSDTEMISGWASSQDLRLPNGTAYSWDANTVLKFNYHLKNYDSENILPCDIYVNVYTQPVGTALHEMKSDFYLYSSEGPAPLFIPQGEQEFEWPLTNFYGVNQNDSVHFWLLAAHTHQLGTDYDIYKRNPDGSHGEQIYEGFYDFNYTFNQGYFSYDESPVLIDDNFISIKASDGLILEADYNNTTGGLVTFGLTTNDEMFGLFLQYVKGDISDLDALNVGTNELETPSAMWQIYPNPNNGNTNINYHLPENKNVRLSIYNTVGQKVADLLNFQQAAGTYNYRLDAEVLGLTTGMYMVQLQVGENISTKKMMIAQ